MSDRSLQEDSLYYRLEYARIARLLEEKTRPRSPEKPSSPQLPLSRAASKAIDATLSELIPEQEAAGADSDFLWMSAAALALEAEDQLRRLRWRWVGRRPVWYLRVLGRRHRQRRREYLVLAEFLDQVLEPATVALYFSCLVEEDRVDADEPMLDRRRPPNRPLRRAKLSGKNFSHGDFDCWMRDYLSYLVGSAEPAEPTEERQKRRPGALMRLLTRLARHEKRLLAWLGVTWFRPPTEPNYRVRYNLACLFSRAAAHSDDREDLLDAAERQLQLALDALRGARRRALAEWALRDPGLASLRNAEGYRFARIVPAASNRSRT